MQARKTTFADFGERLRSLIVDRLGNEAEAARRTGITPQAINTYVRENRLPKAEQLYALACALGVTMDELLTGNRPSHSSAEANIWKEKAHSAEQRVAMLKAAVTAALEKF